MNTSHLLYYLTRETDNCGYLVPFHSIYKTNCLTTIGASTTYNKQPFSNRPRLTLSYCSNSMRVLVSIHFESYDEMFVRKEKVKRLMQIRPHCFSLENEFYHNWQVADMNFLLENKTMLLLKGSNPCWTFNPFQCPSVHSRNATTIWLFQIPSKKGAFSW